MTTATALRTQSTTPFSAADVAAHAAASHVRLPRRTPVAPSASPSPAELRSTTEIAYLQRDRQLAEQVAYELAAGGDES